MNIAVIYWSGTGNTQAMAEAVKEGAESAGAEVTMFEAAEFSADKVNDFDAFAFGCPSMGSEELEDTEFQPMFDSVKGSIGEKKTALFGSYGWGDGEWMRTWQADCEAEGINIIMDGVIANEAPNEDALAQLNELGKALA